MKKLLLFIISILCATTAMADFGGSGWDQGNHGFVTINGGATPSVTSFGQLSGDNDFWATGRGAPLFFDGTSTVALVGTLASDNPSNGQVPTWNTGGTITWETPSAAASITGADTSVIFLDGANTPSTNANFTFNKTTGTLSVTAVTTATTNTPKTEYFPTLGTDTHYVLGVNGDGGNNDNDKFGLYKGSVLGTAPVFECSGVTSCTFTASLIATIDSSTATTFFKVPQGSAPTVDAAGKIAIDTTNDQIQYYGGAKRVLSYIYSKSFTIISPTATDDYPIWRTPYAITITGVHVQCTGGTNIIGGIDNANSSGASPSAIDSDITASAGANANDDGSLSSPSIASGNYVYWHTTSISGTPTSVTVTYDYTINAT